MRQPIKIDISTDDVITPKAVEYDYKLMFEDRTISVLTYNKETLLAEKMQTIINRGIANTRLRDFYDVYSIMNFYGEQIEKQVLYDAFSTTCEKRKTIFSKDDIEATLHLISDDLRMAELWGQFQKSNYPEIFQTASGKSLAALSWSHYAALLQVNDLAARAWYEQEAAQQTWSVRTLQRNISSQYYYRMLKTQKQALVEQEMQEKASVYQNDKLEFIKNPIVTEFLGLSSDTDFTESDLEKSILSNLQKFLMELGKGYAFVARQQHIHTEKQDYYIDLVFYNYILKCFVLIDLKTEKITHGDVGQMDMYIRMYDEMKRSEGDNPTIGIVLCSDTDEDIARYSVMHGSEQLFASKYKLYLPTEEELRAEIETQKAMFYLQQKEEDLEK